jgi:hypothetical protein
MGRSEQAGLDEKGERMRLYKPTLSDGICPQGFQWGDGVKIDEPVVGGIRCYDDPLLAVVLEPYYGKALRAGESYTIWEAEGPTSRRDFPLTVHPYWLTTTRKVPVPSLSDNERYRVAVGCAWQVCDNAAWREYVTRWMEGGDEAINEGGNWEARMAAMSALFRVVNADPTLELMAQQAATLSVCAIGSRSTGDVGACVAAASRHNPLLSLRGTIDWAMSGESIESLLRWTKKENA